MMQDISDKNLNGSYFSPLTELNGNEKLQHLDVFDVSAGNTFEEIAGGCR